MALTWPVEALGQDSGADALFDQGVRALRDGRNDDAISFFRVSHQMEPRASTMCNLAMSYERAGRHAEARDSYRQCAQEDHEGRYREHALERADELDRQLRAQSRPPAYSQPQPPPQQPVTYTSPQPQPQPQPQPEPRRRGHTLAWVGLGGALLGLGGLGTAIGLHVWANNVHDELWSEYEGQIPSGSSAADRVERGRTGVNVAIALYAVGGVLAGAGVLLAILDAIGVGGHASIGARYALRLTPSGLSLAF